MVRAELSQIKLQRWQQAGRFGIRQVQPATIGTADLWQRAGTDLDAPQQKPASLYKGSLEGNRSNTPQGCPSCSPMTMSRDAVLGTKAGGRKLAPLRRAFVGAGHFGADDAWMSADAGLDQQVIFVGANTGSLGQDFTEIAFAKRKTAECGQRRLLPKQTRNRRQIRNLAKTKVSAAQAAALTGSSPVLCAAKPARTRAEAGFMVSTIAVGIRIVAPRSLVVS